MQVQALIYVQWTLGQQQFIERFNRDSLCEKICKTVRACPSDETESTSEGISLWVWGMHQLLMLNRWSTYI